MSQDFTFSAKLSDKVTPNLGKIEGKLRSVQSSLGSFIEKFKSGDGEISASSASMQGRVASDLGSLDKALRTSAEEFNSLEKKATVSAKHIAEAVQDSLYGKGAEERIDALDRDLGKLNKTFGSMASRQKAVTGRARTLTNTTRDSLNRRIIPAFQDLHATLDEYPDTLEEINKLESERYDILEKQPGLLNKVKDSMSGLGEKAKDIKFGLDDALATITTGFIGHVGLQVQEQQRNFAKLGGMGGVSSLPRTLQEATLKGKAPIEEIAPILQAMRQLRSVAQEDMPDVAAEFFNLSKALQMTGEELVHFHDRMTRVQGINDNQFRGLLDAVAGIAQESTATEEELMSVIQSLGPEMLAMTEEARVMYAKSAISAAAVARDSGLDMSTAQNIRDRLVNDPQARIKMQGLFSSAGLGNIDNYLDDPEALLEATQKAGRRAFNYSKRDIATNARVREQIANMSMGMIDPDILLRDLKTTGEGTGGAGGFNKEYDGILGKIAGFVRGTTTEKMEQVHGVSESGVVMSGEKLISATGRVIGKIEEMATKGVKFFDKMDRKMGGHLSSGLAGGMVAKTAFGVSNAITGGGLSDFLSGGEGKGSIKEIIALTLAAIATHSFVHKEEGTIPKEVQEISGSKGKTRGEMNSYSVREQVNTRQIQGDLYSPEKAEGNVADSMAYFENRRKTTVKSTGNEATLHAQGTLDKIVRPMERIARSAEGFGELSKTWESIKNTFKNIVATVKEIIPSFSPESMSSFKDVLKGVRQGLAAIVKIPVKNFIRELKIIATVIKGTLRVFAGGLELLSKGVLTAVKAVKSLNKGFKTFLNPLEMTKKLLHGVERGFEYVGEHIIDVQNLLKTWDFKTFWENVFDGDKIIDIARDFWKSFMDQFLHLGNNPAEKKKPVNAIPAPPGSMMPGPSQFASFRSVGEAAISGNYGSPGLDGDSFTTVGGYNSANATLVKAKTTGNDPGRVIAHKKQVTATRSIQETRKDKVASIAETQLSVQQQMLAQLTQIAQNLKAAPTGPSSGDISPAATPRAKTPGERQAEKINSYTSGRRVYGPTALGSTI